MKTITQNQYQQLVGLQSLAERCQKWRDEIEAAVREITGEPDDSYHATDFIYADQGLRGMLKRLEITVERSAPIKEGQHE
jgi:hypothetical protein